MAKKSISDIVLRAVVDTSGVAAGLNNIGSQVSGRSFGQSGGGPTGASGAAGGFVNPHGGGAGAGAAAVAAAAAAGVALGRGRGGRLAELAANPGAVSPAARAGMARQTAIRNNPLTNLLYNKYQQPLFDRTQALYDASTLSRDAGSRRAADAYGRQAGILRERFNRRNAALGRMARNPFGQLLGEGVRLGQFAGGLSRQAGQMMGMGRLAPLGGPAMLGAGAIYGGIQLGQMGNEGMPSRFSDITRFEFGADRQAARQLKRDWSPSNKKAPLGFMDRFFVEGRKANNGQATWVENTLRFSGEQYQKMAAEMGANTATFGGTVSNVLQLASPPYMMAMALKRIFS
jgi:hypothetical protein